MLPGNFAQKLAGDRRRVQDGPCMGLSGLIPNLIAAELVVNPEGSCRKATKSVILYANRLKLLECQGMFLNGLEDSVDDIQQIA